MGSEDLALPVPGSRSSGPLLAASGDMDPTMEELYDNVNGMPTQRLEYGPVDADDVTTSVNLTLRDSMPGFDPTGENSGSLETAGGPAAQTSSDDGRASKAAGSRSSNSKSKANVDDPIAKMKQLKTLLDTGLITEEDYASKKADILARI
jgi:hypothetical protein